MKMIKKYMTSCDEATTISDKDQYQEASSWELVKLGFHTMMCKSCKVYTIQNKIVTKALEVELTNENQDAVSLSNTEKDELKTIIKKA